MEKESPSNGRNMQEPALTKFLEITSLKKDHGSSNPSPSLAKDWSTKQAGIKEVKPGFEENIISISEDSTEQVRNTKTSRAKPGGTEWMDFKAEQDLKDSEEIHLQQKKEWSISEQVNSLDNFIKDQIQVLQATKKSVSWKRMARDKFFHSTTINDDQMGIESPSFLKRKVSVLLPEEISNGFSKKAKSTSSDGESLSLTGMVELLDSPTPSNELPKLELPGAGEPPDS